jgi:hypothetical protein
MPRGILIAGLLLCLVCPTIAAIGLWSTSFMPGCTGGSSGPASGCVVAGVSFNWFVQLATLAFLASFVTVPVGVLAILSGVAMHFLKARERTRRPYGIYDAQGILLSSSESASAIKQFDREACNALLRKFGQAPSPEAEPLSAARLRCGRALGVAMPIDA